MVGHQARPVRYLLLFVLAGCSCGCGPRCSVARRAGSAADQREPRGAGGSILRTGLAFTAASIGMALVMTSVAVAAPLTSECRASRSVWSDVRDQVGGLFGALQNPEARLPLNSFGSQLVISEQLDTSDEPVLSCRRSGTIYLASWAYDHYTGRGWDRRRSGPDRWPQAARRSSGPPPNGRSWAMPSTPRRSRSPSTRRCRPEPVHARVPAAGVRAGRGWRGGGWAAVRVPGVIGRNQRRPGVQIEAAVSRATEAELSNAGTLYPTSIVTTYLDTAGLTDRTRQLALQIVAGVPADPYHQAKALAAYLHHRGRGLQYSTHAPLPDDPNQDFVDFFLFDSKTGFCEHYASAMAMMARSLGIPATAGRRLCSRRAAAERRLPGSQAQRPCLGRGLFPRVWLAAFEATDTRSVPERRPGNGAPPINGTEDIASPSTVRGSGPAAVPPASCDPFDGGFLPGTAPPVDERGSSRAGTSWSARRPAACSLAWRWLGLPSFRFLAPADRQWAGWPWRPTAPA